jgi:hypothetical protein
MDKELRDKLVHTMTTLMKEWGVDGVVAAVDAIRLTNAIKPHIEEALVEVRDDGYSDGAIDGYTGGYDAGKDSVGL